MSAVAKHRVESMNDLAQYISSIIEKESGNILGVKQQSMVVNRLKKRMIDLGNIDANGYLKYLDDNHDSEIQHLVSLLTTHYTFFFREYVHFEFIEKNISTIVSRAKSRGSNKIRIHCLACSRGQEVYSLAMLMDKVLKKYPEMDYEIVGSDIDQESVRYAKNGVYRYDEIIQAPRALLANHWKRGVGEISQYVKVKPSIQEKCLFKVANLLDFTTFKQVHKYDMVFCRNVFIYFDTPTIKKVCTKIKDLLYPQGYLFTGLSESLKTTDMEIYSHETSVYSFDPHVEAVTKEAPATEKVLQPIVAAKPEEKKPIRLLAVDDSKSVLKLLKKIFAKDPDFELIGTAENGVEAEEFLKTNTVDAMTLDIHMPEMDGVQYLEKNYRQGHPKVVVISSASREDSRYAQRTIDLGASDFVEKPTLNNLSQRAEEIKMKIKTAVSSEEDFSPTTVVKSFEKDFKIADVNSKARVLFANYSDREKIKATLKTLNGDQPPVFVFFEGNSNFLNSIKEDMEKTVFLPVKIFDQAADIHPGEVYICDFAADFSKFKESFSSKKSSVGIFGACSNKVVQELLDWGETHLMAEDTDSLNPGLKDIASDIFPWTSFAHLGTESLADC